MINFDINGKSCHIMTAYEAQEIKIRDLYLENRNKLLERKNEDLEEKLSRAYMTIQDLMDYRSDKQI